MSNQPCVSRRTQIILVSLSIGVCLPAAALAQTQPIFGSVFGNSVSLAQPEGCNPGGTCYQRIVGHDDLTQSLWPPQVWGSQAAYANGTVLQMISGVGGTNESNIEARLFNRIVTVAGRDGNATNKALHSQIIEGPGGQNPVGGASTQAAFHIYPTDPAQNQLYISYWVRFQPDMISNMLGLPQGPGVHGNGGTWRSIFALKTGTLANPAFPGQHPGDNGDFRIGAYVFTGCSQLLVSAGVSPCTGLNPNPAPYYVVIADDNAGAQPAGDTHWIETKTGVTVPNDGSWNKVEVFWRRGPTNSRFWMAINGVQLVDRAMGTNLPVNRIMPSLLYTGGRLPAYQWMDDLQIWADFPPASCTYPQEPWCNPPYAAH